jgi:aspartyl-tRNA synthetase
MDWRERIYCGAVTAEDADKDVLLMGWVDAIRDHGNVLFIHLRDVSGVVQVVFDPMVSAETSKKAADLKEEYVIEVLGRVALREKGTENPNLKTGELEVFASRLNVLSTSKILPFPISEKAMIFGAETAANPDRVEEDLRLRFRYLDLRRPSVQDFLTKRYRIIKGIRDYLHEQGFVEIETPFLTRSTPEGARDYLVPSRMHRGKFYALPQSPQLFKQLLMMGGMDRYFQIARCFRDEDLRPNRQPEFTQLDIEASFIDEEFIYEIIEELVVRMFGMGGIHLSKPFLRMTYERAMDLYGTDRPDMRFQMAFEEVTDIARDTRYAVFRQIAREGGHVKGLCVRGEAGNLSKNVLQNEYAMKIVPSFGAKGMTWMKVNHGKLESNIVQFFSQTERDRLIDRFGAKDEDVLIMIADHEKSVVNQVLGRLRLHLAERLNLIPNDRYCPLWVTDFPLFEVKDGQLSSQHHPFTMPDRTDFDPENREEVITLKSRAYDLVVNGEELGGGSLRIHSMDTQRRIFQTLGLTQGEYEEKFGFFLRALEYGAPPHGGLALGLDRVIAMILGASSIREVIAFPKNRKAYCPLTEAPALVNAEHLEELGLHPSPLIEATEQQEAIPIQPQREKRLSQAAAKISKGEVKHVAKLARLTLSEEEIDSYSHDLNAILDYVETLEALDTGDVSPTSHVLEMENVWRDDTPAAYSETEAILSNAPQRQERYFKVPKILEG